MVLPRRPQSIWHPIHDWFIPEDIVHLRQYLCVGYVHNASYLGGALAIVVACLVVLKPFWAGHGVDEDEGSGRRGDAA